MKNNNKKNQKTGVALLFVIIVIGILFTIAIGVTSMALSQTSFETSARKSNEAFFAADTGAECALYWDNTSTAFPASAGSSTTPITQINCVGSTSSPLNFANSNNGTLYNFSVFNDDNSCTNTAISKTNLSTDATSGLTTYDTKIISKGYNIDGGSNCNSANVSNNIVERELDLNY